MRNEFNETDKYVSNIIKNAVSVFYSENKKTLSEEELGNRFVPNILTKEQFERGYKCFTLHRISKYPK